jgi:hypothetical protein
MIDFQGTPGGQWRKKHFPGNFPGVLSPATHPRGNHFPGHGKRAQDTVPCVLRHPTTGGSWQCHLSMVRQTSPRAEHAAHCTFVLLVNGSSVVRRGEVRPFPVSAMGQWRSQPTASTDSALFAQGGEVTRRLGWVRTLSEPGAPSAPLRQHRTCSGAGHIKVPFRGRCFLNC